MDKTFVPRNSIFLLFSMNEQGTKKLKFGGTAFCFLKKNWLLTAGHNIGTNSPENLIILPWDSFSGKKEEIIHVEEIFIHSNSDLSILKTGKTDSDMKPLDPCLDSRELGTEISSYGYPYIHVQNNTAKIPISRFYQGYIHRYFVHEQNEFSYPALELSIQPAKGLSGSPVILKGNKNKALGLIAGESESLYIEKDVETIEKEGKKEVFETAKTIVTNSVRR